MRLRKEEKQEKDTRIPDKEHVCRLKHANPCCRVSALNPLSRVYVARRVLLLSGC